MSLLVSRRVLALKRRWQVAASHGGCVCASVTAMRSTWCSYGWPAPSWRSRAWLDVWPAAGMRWQTRWCGGGMQPGYATSLACTRRCPQRGECTTPAHLVSPVSLPAGLRRVFRLPIRDCGRTSCDNGVDMAPAANLDRRALSGDAIDRAVAQASIAARKEYVRFG